jgi:acyl carrier protein
MDIETDIKQIVSDISGLPVDSDIHANLYADLGVASIHALQLLTQLEDHFGVPIPDDEFIQATSIAQLASMVKGLNK